MRKILVGIALVLITCSASYGAVSEDMSVYVRRDVFDAKMEAFMNEIRGEFQVMNAKIEALSRRIDDNYHSLEARMNSNYHSLESRIDDMRNYIYWVLVLLGIVVLLPAVQKFLEWRDSRKPLITLEDVNRLLDERLANRPQI